MEPPQPRIAIVGGGPSGLFAAETAARCGASVTVYDGSRSVARKFLVAGYGGLNLTHGEDIDTFVTRYRGGDLPPSLEGMIRAFPPSELRRWAAELGIETFEQRTGRVYPKVMKAAPLVRAWLTRLRELGVTIVPNSPLTDLVAGPILELEGRPGPEIDAVILALGGASWPRTGSTAAWIPLLEKHRISVTPFQPANCGWETDWPAALVPDLEGKPLKNIAVTAAGRTVRGELMLTRYGVEGGAIYQLGPELRSMGAPQLRIDFKPESSVETLLRKMESVPRNHLAAAGQRWKLPAHVCRLLELRAPFPTARSLAETLKSFPLDLRQPRPIAEAISSAGGVAWSELDSGLMLRRLPGVFLAGEMIDWEAPTGGYLMQACFATGRQAALSAVHFASQETEGLISRTR